MDEAIKAMEYHKKQDAESKEAFDKLKVEFEKLKRPAGIASLLNPESARILAMNLGVKDIEDRIKARELFAYGSAKDALNISEYASEIERSSQLNAKINK